MSQSVLLKPAGMYTFPNRLSSTPQGAMVRAVNMVIDRDAIASSRRGYKIYSNAMGSSSSNTAHQLMNYKTRVLRHWGTGAGQYLDWDDGSGTFTTFSTSLTADTHSNTTIDGMTTTSGLFVGMYVSGSGVAANTTISSINSNTSITISAATTSSLSATTITFQYKVAEVSSGTRVKSVESNGNLYMTTSDGIKKLSVLAAANLSGGAITQAGMFPALDLYGNLNSTAGFLSADSVVAYRVVWGIRDANNNVILGAPSERIIVRNPTAASKTVDLNITIPRGVTTSHFYQVYRSEVIATSTSDPGDELQLAYESNPVNADLTNGYVTVTDITPDSFLGAFLYTNENSGQGILQSNYEPPLAYDVTSFKNYTFYANTTTKQRLNLALLSVSDMSAYSSYITIGQTYRFNTQSISCKTYSNTTVDTIPSTATLKAGQSISGQYIPANAYIVSIDSATSITISAAATGTATTGITAGYEDTTLKYVMISQFSTPAQQVEETARSLERVINRQSNESVYCYYLSGPNDVPGKMLLEARLLNQSAFSVTANSTTTGAEFSPALSTIATTNTTSTNENSPNRLYYSKVQQPDAVPLLNYLDIGPKDKSILRILALRDNLYVLKEEGIYRLTGLVAPFQVYPFDFSTSIRATDSAVVLNNQIYMFSDQGVTTVSDSGVAVVSRPIEDELIKLLSVQYTNFDTATFGVAYESDRAYYLFTVSETSDTYATQCFRWNTFTQSWTLFDIAKRSGIVNDGVDKLFLSPTDTNYVEVERKNFDRTDLADREQSRTLATGAVDDTTITLTSLTDIEADDVVVQTQYVTVRQFNRLLSKLDNDPLLSPHDYVSSLSASAGDNLSTEFDSLVAHIGTDTGRAAVTGCINNTSQTVTITNASPAVCTNATNTTGYYNGMPIRFTTTGALPTGLTVGTVYYVVDLGTDGASKFRVAATSGGTAINTSSAGSGTHTAVPAYACLSGQGAASFSALQTVFNLLIGVLNNDVGVGYSNYQTVSGTVDYEFYIVSTDTSDNTIESPYAYPLIAGPITIYNHIPVELQFIPQTLGDVSMTKHVSEGTYIFEDAAFTKADVSYATDLSADFQGDTINGAGNGIFGNTPFGEGLFGGNGSGVPFRTYLPRDKQRARYVNVKFEHSIAREQFYLYGISLTYNVSSQRGWR